MTQLSLDPGSAETGPFLNALAVTGTADDALLATIANAPLDAAARATLHAHPSVRVRGGAWQIDPAVADAWLAHAAREEAELYGQLHLRAVDALSHRLSRGDHTVEPLFAAVFERTADHFLLDVDQFSRIVASAETIPLQHPDVIALRRYFRAVALRKQANYEAALAEFDALLANLPPNAGLRGRALNSRAACYLFRAQFEDALQDFEDSLLFWRARNNQLRTGLALMNLSTTYQTLEDWAAAETRIVEAITCFETANSPQWLAAARNELGLLYTAQGRWSDAIIQLEAALEQHQQEGASDAAGRILNNIGEIYLYEARWEDARHAFETALAQMETQVHRIDALAFLGLVSLAQQDSARAERDFTKALEITHAIGRSDFAPFIYYCLSVVQQRTGRLDAAYTTLVAGVNHIESSRQPLRDEQIRISWMGRWQQLYEALTLLCLEQGATAEAFRWAERARARAFAEAVMDDGEPEMDIMPVTDVRTLQGSLSAESTVLCYFTTGVLARDIPLLRHIAPDNPLRQHLLAEAKTVLFVITRDAIDSALCPIDPNHLTGPATQNAPVERMLHPRMRQRLAHLLLQPAGNALNADDLYIIPHGPLHNVPFCALTSGQTITYAPNATLLQRYVTPRFVPPSLAPARTLAVAYDGSQTGGALPFTLAEARFIASKTGGDAIIGGDIEPSALAVRAAQARWIHFACHGAFLSEDPLASYLQIGPDCRLSARDVLAQWRIRADLVTLSACLSGTSTVLRGDEPLGLVRAFLTAGARSVLVTQWEVDDLATYVLMRLFYGALLADHGTTQAAALRAAQMRLSQLTFGELRRKLDEWGVAEWAHLPPASAESQPFAHPRYWAAFMLIG